MLSSNEGKGVGLEYDSFGVAMFTSGTAQTPYRPAGLVLDTEGLDFSGPPVACPLYANRALALSEEQCGGGPPGQPVFVIPIICTIACIGFAIDIITCWPIAKKKCKKKKGVEYFKCMYNELARCACWNKKHPLDVAACLACAACVVHVVPVPIPVPHPVPAI